MNKTSKIRHNYKQTNNPSLHSKVHNSQVTQYRKHLSLQYKNAFFQIFCANNQNALKMSKAS